MVRRYVCCHTNRLECGLCLSKIIYHRDHRDNREIKSFWLKGYFLCGPLCPLWWETFPLHSGLQCILIHHTNMWFTFGDHISAKYIQWLYAINKDKLKCVYTKSEPGFAKLRWWLAELIINQPYVIICQIKRIRIISTTVALFLPEHSGWR